MIRGALWKHAFMTAAASEKPLVAIVGATGTGKSNLAVHLAERFNGEVINGDALQMYKGMPITTNKISSEERKGVPHHILDCIGIDEPTWTVSNFMSEASKAMASIRQKGKLPILVGGTHYYTQSLLFDGQTVKATQSASKEDSGGEESSWPILEASGPEMLEALRKVDPEMAARWHPNDTRKIRRSLEIWLQTGRRASDIYDEQAEGSSCVESNTRLRTNVLVFWVHTDGKVLTARTSARLDQMLVEGLLDEVQTMSDLHAEHVSKGLSVDDTRGIWVAIGYKEFAEYTQALRSGVPPATLAHLKAEALERAKIATRQYAKRQVRWIQLKLLPSLKAAGASERFFVLDSSNLDNWSTDVLQSANNITKRFLAGEVLPDPSQASAVASSLITERTPEGRLHQKARVCDVCSITCTTQHSWDQHMKSKKHRKAANPRQRYEPSRTPDVNR